MKDWHLKGNRMYIQGPTFFDYILENYVSGVYQPHNIDFSSSKLTGRKCLIIPYRKDIAPADKTIGQYRDNRNLFYIIETEEPVTVRVPYHEEEITRLCLLKDNEIEIPAKIPGYSFMEKIVAAYKFLLTSLYSDQYGKYLFARVTLDFIPEKNISIQHKRIISNRYFEGALQVAGAEIGKIFFGAKKK